MDTTAYTNSEGKCSFFATHIHQIQITSIGYNKINYTPLNYQSNSFEFQLIDTLLFYRTFTNEKCKISNGIIQFQSIFPENGIVKLEKLDE